GPGCGRLPRRLLGTRAGGDQRHTSHGEGDPGSGRQRHPSHDGGPTWATVSGRRSIPFCGPEMTVTPSFPDHKSLGGRHRSARGLRTTEFRTGRVASVPRKAAIPAATTTRPACSADGMAIVVSGLTPMMVSAPATAPRLVKMADPTVIGNAAWRARDVWSVAVGAPARWRAARVVLSSRTDAAAPTPVAKAAWIRAMTTTIQVARRTSLPNRMISYPTSAVV